MRFDFRGKRAIVAGGSRGIGRSIALGFAEAGAAVSICARGAESLAATRDELARFGGTVHAASCDLADGEAVGRYIAQAAEALGGIDVLVNNASGFGSTDDEAGWAASVAVDLLATVRASHAAEPHQPAKTKAPCRRWSTPERATCPRVGKGGLLAGRPPSCVPLDFHRRFRQWPLRSTASPPVIRPRQLVPGFLA